MSTINLDKDEPPVDVRCTTKVGKEAKFRFAWTIERFSDRQEENGEFLASSKFTFQGPDNMETHWSIKLYPKGVDSKSIDISVYLLNS